MEVKNYLLIVVVILAFALVSVNLGDLTGATTKTSSTTIKVTPASIQSGGTITIDVSPSSIGVRNEVKIYKGCNSPLMENCEGNKIATLNLCSGGAYTISCRKPIIITYKTSSGLKAGMYYAKVTESKKGDNEVVLKKKAFFNIG